MTSSCSTPTHFTVPEINSWNNWTFAHRLIIVSVLPIRLVYLCWLVESICHWAMSQENLSLGFPTSYDSNQAAQLQKQARVLKLSIASRGVILSRQQTTKVLIKLCGCAGWSVPLLFAYGIKQVVSWHGSYKGCLDCFNYYIFTEFLVYLVDPD